MSGGPQQDAAYVAQLRQALTELLGEAASAGKPGFLEAHIARMQDLSTILHFAVADPKATIRQENHNLLQQDIGRFLLAVCGFEEVPRKGKGKGLSWRIPPGAERASRLALEQVLAQTEEAQQLLLVQQQQLLAAPEAPLPPAPPKWRSSDTYRGKDRGNRAEALVSPQSSLGAASPQPSPKSNREESKALAPPGERQAVARYVQRRLLASAAKERLPPRRLDFADDSLKLSEQERLMSMALEESLVRDHGKRRDAGSELPLSRILQLGATFEEQPDGSDTCAIHCLNNVAQARMPLEDEGAAAAAATAVAAAQEAGEVLDLRGLYRTELFCLADLQEAEVESEAQSQEGQSRFLAPLSSIAKTPTQALSSRSLQGAVDRTGMFDIEAVKLAAHKKGIEVIDIEPTPTWAESPASRYVDAARKLEGKGGKDRWLLGFVVYERVPGQATHYYSLLRWQSPKSEEESWLLLDSMDRGSKCPRNRLLSSQELVEFYDGNGHWFKSWLVRWYPVVDRACAVSALSSCILKRLSEVCEAPESWGDRPALSAERAESALEEDHVRWDVLSAAEELLKSGRLVERELQVLSLAVSEEQARWQLERENWAFEKAVKSQAERLLQQCEGLMSPTSKQSSAGTSPKPKQLCRSNSRHLTSTRSAYSALQLSDWNVRSAAQVLLLSSQDGDQQPLATRMKAAAAALEECDWNLDHAAATLQLLQLERGESGDGGATGSELTEADCCKVLELTNFDKDLARKLLLVQRRFPETPIAVCAEAFRREQFHPPSAIALLVEFQSRLRDLVQDAFKRYGEQEPGLPVPSPHEVDQVVKLALDVSQWNPNIAFSVGQDFARSIVAVRMELFTLEMKARARAMEVLEGLPSSKAEGCLGGGGPASASEQQVAKALDALDSMDELKRSPPDPPTVMDALHMAEMFPGAAAAQIWQARTGLPVKAPPPPSPPAESSRPPPESSRNPPDSGRPRPEALAEEKPHHRLPPPPVAPPITAGKGKEKKKKGDHSASGRGKDKGRDCVVS